MAVQDVPVCFDCTDPVQTIPVYEAPCGHDTCASVVFHGLCLMHWRERRQAMQAESNGEEVMAWVVMVRKNWNEEHTENS